MNIHVPQGVRQGVSRYSGLFSSEFSWKDYNTLFCLHLFGYRTLSDFVRSAPWSQSVSVLSEAIQHFPSETFKKRYQSHLLNRFKEVLSNGTAIFALDDTSNKKYGDSIFGFGRWMSHNNGLYYGQRILVLSIVDRTTGLAFPLDYRVCQKGPSGKQDVSAFDLAIEILKDIEAVGFPKAPIAADSWFDSASFMEKLQHLNWRFVIELKSNRLVKTNPSKTARWSSLSKIFRGKPRTSVKYKAPKALKGKTKAYSQQRLMIKKRSSYLNVIAVHNHLRGRPFAFYATNDLQLGGAEIWRISRSRWHHEEMFRNLKGLCSFGKLPCQGQSGTDASILFSFMVLSEVQEFDLKRWGVENLQPQTVGELIRHIREKSFQKSFDILIKNSKHPLIPILKNRRDLSRVCKKPVNSIAGDHKINFMYKKSA